MSMHSGSLRFRLSLLFGAVLLVGGALILWAANNFARRAADEAYDRLLESAALSAMESLAVRDGALDFDLPYAALDTLGLARDDRVVYRLQRQDGSVLTGYEVLPEPDAKTLQQDADRGRPHFFTELYDGEPFRFVVLGRQLLESQERGWVWLQMGQSRLAREALAQDLTFKASLGILGLITLGWLFVWLASRWSLTPLLVVERELLERKPTELKPLQTAVPSEIRQLVEAINRFMGRLQRNQDRNHAFIAEAAHQLRTPLASLQAQAELVADEADPQVLRGRVGRILRNALETTSRINQLLNYATLAHRADVLVPERFRLDQYLPVWLADLAPIAVRQDVGLNFDNHAGEAWVSADPEAVREVLRNLVDNALKYGQQATARREVEVGLARGEAGWVNVQVRDFGAGMPEGILNSATLRFGRGEFHQQAGSGLGLAIVEQIAHGLGGRLLLENLPEGGLRASLCLQELLPP